MLRRRFIASLIAAVASSPAARAAEVVYVDPRLGFLVIDKGQSRDMAQGANVCLIGDDGFIITCSGVILANRTKAALRLPKNEMERVRAGLKVLVKAVYLKDETPAGGKDEAAVFRPAKTRPETIPQTLRDAASAKERELSAQQPQAERQESQERQERQAGAAPSTSPVPPLSEAPPVLGQEMPHDAKDPYQDLDKLANAFPVTKEAERTVDVSVALEEQRKAKSKPPARRLVVEAHALAPVVSPVAYNDVAFAPIDPEAASTTLWASKSGKTSGRGLGAVVRIMAPPPKRSGYAVGFRRWASERARAVSGVDVSFPELSSESETSAEATGASLEWVYALPTSTYTSNVFGIGVDGVQSEVRFSSAYGLGDGGRAIVAHARSRLTIASLKLTATQDVSLGRYGLSLGVASLVPILRSLSHDFDAMVAPPSSARFGGDADEDLKRALGHKAGSFGFEASLGLTYAF